MGELSTLKGDLTMNEINIEAIKKEVAQLRAVGELMFAIDIDSFDTNEVIRGGIADIIRGVASRINTLIAGEGE